MKAGGRASDNRCPPSRAARAPENTATLRFAASETENVIRQLCEG